MKDASAIAMLIVTGTTGVILLYLGSAYGGSVSSIINVMGGLTENAANALEGR